MAKKSIWDDGPSRYGTYKGERGNPSQWGATFDFAFGNSDTVKILIGKTAYTTLGLQISATQDEIKSAYRRLVRIHHPDKGGNAQKFHEITTAYNTLTLKTPPLFTSTATQTEVEDEPVNDMIIVPQLLTPIDEDDLALYLDNDDFGAQEKKNGRHITLQIKNNKFFIRNKKGVASNFAPEFEQSLRQLGCDILLDGEHIGNKFHVWDILEYNNKNLRTLPYSKRYSILSQINFRTGPFAPPIELVKIAIGKAAKVALYNSLKADGKEGIVFKKLAALFTPGKGDDQFKFKFYAEASVIVVAGRPGKNSIGMELYGPNGREFVGFCTCTLHPLPTINSVAEIKYLYAHKGGCLTQPSFKELRDDVALEECTLSQLKYKYEEE